MAVSDVVITNVSEEVLGRLGLTYERIRALKPDIVHVTLPAFGSDGPYRAYRTWGTWPYEQQLSDTTYWCAVYGDHITYYSSTANATGTLCDSSWRSSQVTSGGIGYSWFVVRTSAGWSCPTVVPWFNLHPSHYMDYSRNAWGSTEYVGSG